MTNEDQKREAIAAALNVLDAMGNCTDAEICPIVWRRLKAEEKLKAARAALAAQAAPAGAQDEADMFWDYANPERMAYSLHEVVIEHISDCDAEVGDEVTIQCAKRLPNVVVRILDAESGDYEEVAARQQESAR